MHNPLEEYLNVVAERLSPLPVARRNEELREMRQHLLNAVIVNREFGQSEAEAAANAIEQFGSPHELANSLVGTWQRGEAIQNRRSFWGATASTLALLFFAASDRPVYCIPHKLFQILMVSWFLWLPYYSSFESLFDDFAWVDCR